MRFANFRVTVMTKRKEKKKSKRATARVSMLTSSRQTHCADGGKQYKYDIASSLKAIEL